MSRNVQTQRFHERRRRPIIQAGVTLLLAGLAGNAPGSDASIGAPPEPTVMGLTIDGVPFADARAGVTNARRIEIDGTSIVLATWDEPIADGEAAPHFGISLDGNSMVRVARASYELDLRYARFDPLQAVPAVDPRLGAPPESHLFLVQFVTQPLGIFDRQIAALGGIVHHYVSQFTYVVEIDPAALAAVTALPYVRWVGAYHPAYRLEEALLGAPEASRRAGARPARPPAAGLPLDQVYNLQVLRPAHKRTVAARVATIGGRVRRADAGKLLVEAVLTPGQLLEVARWNEILFIDRWGPFEPDMDIVRAISGANYIESVAGYDGTGVRGEVFDIGFNPDHVDFQSRPLVVHGGAVNTSFHGASTSGILFGDGTGNGAARGMLPAAQGIVADWDNVGLSGPSRYAHSAELLEPPYEAVFQSTSGGSPRTTLYTTISAEHDALLFDLDIVFCQSGGNSGDPNLRPQASAKNVITAGGVYHYDNLDPLDDCWCGSATTGPASDGRVKPTLVHFYDSILTTGCCTPDTYTYVFGGVSAATPIICGHVGLFFQMWSDGIFGNPVAPQGTVFENRCHMTTAKAMLINTAEQYPFSGTSHDMARMHQGWGLPSVRAIYDLRDSFFIVDETEVLQPFATATYTVEVANGQPALKATMIYADPPGNPANQSQHRINDLDLRLIAPSGTLYRGNVGLMESPWSLPDGDSDTKNTVENVYIMAPEPGEWTIEVQATELIQDGHVETPALDVDFALVVSGVVSGSAGVAAPEQAPAPDLQLAVLGIGAGNPAARISFRLAAATPVRLRIFDVQGRLVTTAFEGALDAGPQTLGWAGDDDAGVLVGAGVYFARLEAGERAAHAKILVIR